VNGPGLAARQVRYENKAFWRNPAAAFFTFAFPLIFLVIFNLLFGNQKYSGFAGVTVKAATFYTPAIIAFSVITACYTNIAMRTTFGRDQGVLKRIRGTPMPPGAYLGARIIHSVLISVLLVVIVTAFGWLFYDVHLPGHTLPAFLVTLAVGAGAFCALGLAITGFVPNADAAPAVVNASILPLLFVSDVFIPLDKAPKWLVQFANVFPIRHFSHAMLTAFNPFERGSGFAGGDLAVVAIWGLIGVAVASHKFDWEPRV
jgi:ABC-2 type transport system permease protein